MSYDECDVYDSWLGGGKAVFHTEYATAQSDLDALANAVCPARPALFSTLLKTWDLGPEFASCE